MTNLIATLIVSITTNVVTLETYVITWPEDDTVAERLAQEFVDLERVIVLKKVIAHIHWQGRIVPVLMQTDVVDSYERNRSYTLFEAMKKEE